MSTVERVPKIFSAFFCRSLTLHQSLITPLKQIFHRRVEYGLKVPDDITFSDAKRPFGWSQRATWEKIHSSTQNYGTPSKLLNEIKENLLFKSVKKCFILKNLTKMFNNSLLLGNS